MKTSLKPKFENQSYGAGGGLPIIKSIWENFGFSYLFSNIDQHSGLAPWKLVFAYISGLIANGSSVNKIAEHCATTPILEEIIGKKAPSQSALSRFFSKDFNWLACSIKHLRLLCTQPETSISEDDIVALDDTKIEHPYGKKMPFLCWLFDNSDKKHIWCMNLVSTLLIRSNGLITPLFCVYGFKIKIRLYNLNLQNSNLLKICCYHFARLKIQDYGLQCIDGFCVKIYFNGLPLIILIG